MLSDENKTVLKDWADAVRKTERALRKDVEGRDGAIRAALELGAGVGEIVKITGLTRARVYQIRDRR